MKLSCQARLLCGASALLLLSQPARAQPASSGAEQGSPPVADQAGQQEAQPAAAPTDTATKAVSGIAPAAPDTGNEIVVTGSRLARAGFDTVQPAVVLGSQQIENLGYTNVGDALSELPQFGVAANNRVGGQSGFGAGQTFVDFFQLGSQRTLVLVNGRRFVSSNTASIFGPTNPGTQVDLNAIPETLVDRVETVAIGGAPIYGSDAIAGTVNIILKRNFDGFHIDGLNGISDHGDGADHRVSAIIGKNFADDRGNIVVSGEYEKESGLTTADRSTLVGGSSAFFTTTARDNVSYQQQLYYRHRYNIFTQYGTPLIADSIPEFAGVSNGSGNVQTFDRNGHLTTLDFGTRTGSLIESAGGNGFDIDNFGNLQVSSERYLGTALGSFKFSDALRFFGEAWYSHSKATNLVAQPYYSTALFGGANTANGNLLLNVNNPFLTATDSATIRANLAAAGEAGGLDLDGDGTADTAPGSFLLTRANTDLQGGVATSVAELYRFVGGVDGDYTILGKPWHYEASLNYGHSKVTSAAPNLVFQNLQNSLNATTDANGNIVCAAGYTSAPIKTQSSNCAPIDVFGQSSTTLQRDALKYITAIARSQSIDTQFVADINTQGTIFRLPGGDVAVSLGYEHRREKTSFDPGTYYFGEVLPDGSRQGYGNSIPIDPLAGAFHTDEGFGELRVPIVSPQMGWRFLSKFELEAAARYVSNSLAGKAWTYTAGGELTPVPDVTFRGNYTRSIRTPAITEAFNPTSSAFDSGQDPCDARYIGQGPNPANRAKNCAAAGIAQPFTSNYSDFTVPVTVSGNPDLTNEVANSFTYGAVIRPRFIKNLTISADYISISLKKAIVTLGGNDILNACYDAASFPSTFCNLVTRDAAGQITLIKEGYYNAATSKLKAVTAELAYQLNLDQVGLTNWGGLNFSFNFYHVIDQYQQVGTGDINHSAGEVGNPKNSFTANLTYTKGGLSFLWQTQYLGPSVFDADAPSTQYQYSGVKHWYLFNASVGYTINKRFDIRLIVDNVTNEKPPFPATADPVSGFNATQAYYAGILGRYGKLSVGVTF